MFHTDEKEKKEKCINQERKEVLELKKRVKSLKRLRREKSIIR